MIAVPIGILLAWAHEYEITTHIQKRYPQMTKEEIQWYRNHSRDDDVEKYNRLSQKILGE